MLGSINNVPSTYRATANKSFEMVNHIFKLQKLQEELHIMGSSVPDEDFVMILITSLLEAWNNYTLAYLGSSKNFDLTKLSPFFLIKIKDVKADQEA